MKRETRAVLVAVVALLLIVVSFLLMRSCRFSEQDNSSNSTDTMASVDASQPSDEPSIAPSGPVDTKPSSTENTKPIPTVPIVTEPVSTTLPATDPVALESIAILTGPDKDVYVQGETFSAAGITLKVVYSDGFEEIISSGFTCTPMVLDTVGNQKINVVYEGLEIGVEVLVLQPQITGIAVKTLPFRTEYSEGEYLDTTGLTLTVYYQNGIEKTVTEGFEVSPRHLLYGENQQITVYYEHFSTTFQVQVQPALVASGTCGDNLVWEQTTGGALIISGTGDMYDYSVQNGAAPWNGFEALFIREGVTSIGENAFYGQSNLKIVEISGSVRDIGSCAFGNCNSLTQVIVDSANDSFVSRDGALYTKDQKELIVYPKTHRGKLVLPDGVCTIRSYAFSGCALSEVVLPDSVVSIQAYAFLNSKLLTHVSIGAGVREIALRAFGGCISLSEISVGNETCVIFGDVETMGDPGVTAIMGLAGSTAEAYAKKYGYIFEVL